MANPTTTPPSPTQTTADHLPTGVKVDHSHSADGFFEAHKAATAPAATAPAATAPAATAPAATAPAATAPAATAPAAPDEPVEKGSLVGRLAKKTKAPPVPAKPETPSRNPEEELSLDHTSSVPARENFERMRGIASGLRDQLNAAREAERQLKAQLEAATKSGGSPDMAELDRLRAENKVFSDRLALVDLQEHPKFQEEFVQPRQQALKDAEALLAANGVTGDVHALLGRSRAEFGKAVSEMAKGLSEFDRSEFTENMRKAWAVNQQAGAALSKSREVYGALRNRTEASQKQAFDKTWARTAGTVAEHIVELEVPDNATPEQRESIERYNAAFKGLRTVSEERAFGPANSETIAEHAIKSAAYDFHIQQAMPKLMQEIDGLLNLNRQLSGELRAIKARNPNLQLSGSSGNPGQPAGAGPDGTLSLDQLSKMGHAEAAAALAPRRMG